MDSSRDAEARRLFLAGEEAYDQGRYEEALDLFTRAHALSGRPGLLFNIGSASERLRRDEQALDAYEEYLRVHPQAANRDYVEARIAFLRDQMTSEQRLREAALRADTPRRESETREETRSETTPSGAPRESASRLPPPRDDGPRAIAPEALAVQTPEEERGGDVTQEWWFWALVGVAVVGAGVGVGVGVAAATGGGDAANPPVTGDFGPGGVVVALEAF